MTNQCIILWFGISTQEDEGVVSVTSPGRRKPLTISIRMFVVGVEREAVILVSDNRHMAVKAAFNLYNCFDSILVFPLCLRLSSLEWMLRWSSSPHLPIGSAFLTVYPFCGIFFVSFHTRLAVLSAGPLLFMTSL